MINPTCPYCGTEMHRTHGLGGGLPEIYPDMIYWSECDNCGAESPKAHKRELADTAAMSRYHEPNRVLSLDDVKALDGEPVWCEDRDGSGAWALVHNEEELCIDADYGDWEYYCYGWASKYGWRAWTSKPTDEERANARWEERHG